ncbi:MAG: outer membrane beta-barrel protein, partial [Pseudomonadota bacterium]
VLGKWTQNAMYLGAGVYLHKPDSTATATHQIIEVMAGTKMSDWTIDAQAVIGKVASTGAESGFGIGGTVNYAWDKTWSFGIRPNYTSKLAAAGSHTNGTLAKTLEVTVGPNVNLSDDMRVRLNYTYSDTKDSATATDNGNDSTWALSAVYKF